MNFSDLMDKAHNIYVHLADEESKYVFMCRLMFSMTFDNGYIRQLSDTLPELVELRHSLDKNKKNYIFGAGVCGQCILFATSGMWHGIIDNNPKLWGQNLEPRLLLPSSWNYKMEKFSGGGQSVHESCLQVMKPANIKIDSDCMFYITARTPGKDYPEHIIEQLKMLGATDKQIVRADKLVDMVENRQYFDLGVLPYVPNGIFADVGSFDGNTALRFVKRAETFKKVYCFEPDTANQEKVKRNLAGLPKEKWTIIPKGAWRCEDILHFTNNGEDTSRISGYGEICVPVTTLDKELSGCGVNFIKMDIEGSELDALEGASYIIRENRPILAISIYHKPEDVICLPDKILSLNNDYKLYMRHYSFAAYDTVVYAI